MSAPRDVNVAEGRALLAKATPGPLVFDADNTGMEFEAGYGIYTKSSFDSPFYGDSKTIAHFRCSGNTERILGAEAIEANPQLFVWLWNNAAELLDAAEREQATTRDVNAALRRLREDNDRLREALERVQACQGNIPQLQQCPDCAAIVERALAAAPATGDKWDAPEGRTHHDPAHAVAIKDAEREVVEAAKDCDGVRGIPFYAYGDNEAACRFAEYVERNIAAVDALRKVEGESP